MYYKRMDDCIDCNDCVNNPSELSCNIACSNTKKNCYESYKVFDPKTYARANIVLQPYQRLFDLNDVLKPEQFSKTFIVLTVK